jgi:hypothetical protein
MEIASLDGSRTVTLSVPATQGINRYFWNLRFTAGGGGGGRGGRGRGGDPAAAGQRAGGTGRGGRGAGGAQAAAGPAGPGTYRVKLTIGDRSATTTLTVRADPGAGR